MIKILKLTFYVSTILLLVISLYPGSLAGFVFYNDLNRQPNLIENPFGTSINHFIYYFYISLLGHIAYLKEKKLKILIFLLLFLSVLLEVFQLLIPGRSFEIFDLMGNILGVLVAYYIIKIYLLLRKP